MIELQLKGAKELERNLLALEKGAKTIINAATREGSKVFLEAMQDNLPGHLRNRLGGPTPQRTRSPYSTAYHVGTSAKHWALVFLEYGVPPHTITPKKKKALVNLYGGDLLAAKVRHPGVRATYWARRAFARSTIDKAYNRFYDVIWTRIRKTLK